MLGERESERERENIIMLSLMNVQCMLSIQNHCIEKERQREKVIARGGGEIT